MALRNDPRASPLKATFNLVTQTGASLLRNLPFGGAFGVVVAGIILWFAPGLVPIGWSAEAVLSLGMGSGVVLQRLVDGAVGWFFEPARRHLGAEVNRRRRFAYTAFLVGDGDRPAHRDDTPVWLCANASTSAREPMPPSPASRTLRAAAAAAKRAAASVSPVSRR